MKTKSLLLFLFASFAVSADNLPTVDVFDDGADTKVSDPDEIPDWVDELSNLPAAQRQRYLNLFAAAKRSYAQGSMGLCENCLDECEAIYAKNPNVWNLRASICISQQSFDLAEKWLNKVRTVAPDDVVSRLNFSMLYMGQEKYEEAIRETDTLLAEIEYKDDMEGIRHTLMFRKFVALIILERTDDAKAVVKSLTPLSFTPLYYYSQSVLAASENDVERALKEMAAADKIYRRDPYLSTYKQVLQFSKVMEKLKARKAE